MFQLHGQKLTGIQKFHVVDGRKRYPLSGMTLTSSQVFLLCSSYGGYTVSENVL